jgi:hypothetical protein
MTNNNYLVRSGTSQDDRYKNLLDPKKVLIDERTISDFILFAQKYSKYIKYYNEQNTVDGNWQEFWKNDISATLAGVVAFDLNEYQQVYQSIRTHIFERIAANNVTAANTTAIGAHLKLLFHLPLKLVQKLSDTYAALIERSDLQMPLARLFEREIVPHLKTLMNYYKAASPIITDPKFIFTSDPLTLADFSDPLLSIELTDMIKDVIANTSGYAAAGYFVPGLNSNLNTYYTNEVPLLGDYTPFLDGSGVAGKVYDALNYNLLSNALESIYRAMAGAARLFKTDLQNSLTNYPEHPAHFGLWLVFIRLYGYGQDELNKYAQRHLEYYYKEVLQEKPRKAKANKVHLLLEAAKDAPKTLLEAGMRFKAGKDKLNKALSYELKENFVLTQAKIVELKSFYHETGKFPIAAIKTNSANGIDLPLTDDYPYWSAFYKGNAKPGQPAARLGFAIADNNLFLKEGTRTIRIIFNNVIPEILRGGENFVVYYTSEKGWESIDYDVDQLSSPVQYQQQSNQYDRRPNAGGPGNSLGSSAQNRSHLSAEMSTDAGIYPVSNENFSAGSCITVEIPPDKPAVVQFDPKVHINKLHKDDFRTSSPVIKVMITSNYDGWSSFNTGEVRLDVKVTGAKDYTILNSDGYSDASKPYFLFGSTPDKLPSFTMGSNEFFSKKLAQLKLNVEWQEEWTPDGYFNPPTAKSINDFTLKVQHLENGIWTSPASSGQTLFEAGSNKNIIDISTEIEKIKYLTDQKIENDLLTPTTRNGFIKVTCDNNFSNELYPTYYADYIIASSKEPDPEVPSPTMPLKPYQGKVVTITVDYHTKLAAPATFFELHPFGVRFVKDPNRVVPVYPDRGELYIGISNLVPPTKLTTLFQVRTGTASPLAEKADIQWSYLNGDQWFDQIKDPKFEVDDKTDELAGSEIIGFVIPPGANSTHRIMPDGLHWIKMSIPNYTNAINDLISIDAQAATVEFVDQENDPQFLNGQLEAESISKAEISNGAIKTILQKYASFDGAQEEFSNEFYVRVAERLRHKDRAITLWDYEHLILQAFPKVYKVKCINHTSVDKTSKPGHVTIVPIPKLQSIFKDPLRPYTDKKTRIEIRKFLEKRISPFVCLHVEQPSLEEVQIECSVSFNDDIADIMFYKQMLNDAIIRHLSPWAFGDGKDVSFGGKWHKADLINFIDERPYVNYITDVRMYHIKDITHQNPPLIDQEVVEASTARSILVSHRNHNIQPLANNNNLTSTQDNCQCEEC